MDALRTLALMEKLDVLDPLEGLRGDGPADAGIPSDAGGGDGGSPQERQAVET